MSTFAITGDNHEPPAAQHVGTGNPVTTDGSFWGLSDGET
jgi:hypothetical protein